MWVKVCDPKMISWYMQPKHSKKLEMLTKPFCKCFEVHRHQIKQIYKQYGTRMMLALQEEKDHIGTLVTWDKRFKGFGIKFRSNALMHWTQHDLGPMHWCTRTNTWPWFRTEKSYEFINHGSGTLATNNGGRIWNSVVPISFRLIYFSAFNRDGYI